MASLEKTSVAAVRRASGRLLRAHRKEIIKMKNGGEIACIEALTRGFIHHSIRKTVMDMWRLYGVDIVGSGIEQKVRRHTLDDCLDESAIRGIG